MKEATQEVNMMAIVVISVGVLLTFFFYYHWPMLNANFESKSKSSKASFDFSEDSRIDINGIEYCTGCYVNGEPVEDMECLYKG